MALKLYYHPLASFCHKVLIALYERGIDFEPVFVDFADPKASAAYLERWPVGKIPLLHDEAAGRTVPETTIIIEYLERTHAGSQPMLPAEPSARLEARLWDRFFDQYVHVPMQKIVTDRLRASGEGDTRGVADARASLSTAYALLERQLEGRQWAIGADFSIVDCAAAPALFYAGIVEPFVAHPRLSAYFERLLERPSYKRVLDEARPYFKYFPYYEAMPRRFARPEQPE